MTHERSQDVAIVALVLSIATHIALMYYMRPQVMTEVTTTAHRAHQRGPMTMRERPPEAEMIRIEVMKDLEALRESPSAVAESPVALPQNLETPDSIPVPAAPEIDPASLELPIPEVEMGPSVAEKIKVMDKSEIFVTPIEGSRVPGLMPTVANTSQTPVSATPTLASAQEIVPEFEAPSVEDELDIPLPDADAATDLANPLEGNSALQFKPETEVMPEVNERIVETEKQAVRDLLNVKDAQELEKFVSFSTASAKEGDWVYFSVKFQPQQDLPVIPKDIVVLFDASASIGKDRLVSCREAATNILRTVTNSGDRFNLVAFRDKFSYAFKSWQECNADSFAAADRWLGKLVAHGRTDIFATIRSVLTLPRDPARPLVAMVVTDGDANSGVSQTAQILSRFTRLNDGLVSVYMYGVKANANKELLDILTHGNRGESFIYGGSRWNAGSGLEALTERFRDPVLSDIRVVFTTSSNAEIYPQRLKNMYRGESVELYGRAPAGTREVAFSIKGLNGAKSYESFFTIPLAESSFDSALPSMWRDEKTIADKLQ